MSQTQKWITIGLWVTVVLAGAGLVAMMTVAAKRRPAAAPPAGVAQPAKLETLYDVPPFELTDQDGKPFAKKELSGKVWIAAFVFTHCAGPCPQMTLKMVELQKDVKRPDVGFLSFTVDPERDTPEVLKKYAAHFGADESRWRLLTGPKQAMHDVAAGMKVAAAEASGDQPITHSTFFLLIDKSSKIVGAYGNSNPDEMKRLANDATELANRT
jgi:protein SCO1